MENFTPVCWAVTSNPRRYALWKAKHPSVPPGWDPVKELPWEDLAPKHQLELWKAKHPAVPKDFLPRSFRPWNELREQQRRRAYLANDPRVPKGYTPPEPVTKETHFTRYQHPDVTVDLTKDLLFNEDRMWKTLVAGWESIGISPNRVLFRFNGNTIMMRNPFYRDGDLPTPVLR